MVVIHNTSLENKQMIFRLDCPVDMFKYWETNSDSIFTAAFPSQNNLTYLAALHKWHFRGNFW